MYIYEVLQKSDTRPYVGMWYFNTYLEAIKKAEELAFNMTFLYKKDGRWYVSHKGDMHTIEIFNRIRIKI